MNYGFKPYEEKEVLRNHINLGGKSVNGGSIEVTSKYFTRDNKPVIPVMGEMHYSRCPRDMWADELAKMKAGGVTVVSTYVIWIYHEEIEGEYDFGGDNDLRAFVRECQKIGLDVIIRVGPWCHGEVRNGGLPDWVLKKPFKLRENNGEYLSLVTKWYSRIADEVKDLFFKDGGNIIGVQLENEYCDSAEHLAKLKEIAISVGMIAPLYTVTGWNAVNGAKIPVDEVVPVFGGYCDAPWETSTEKLNPSHNYFFNQMRNDSAIGADLIKSEDDGWQLPYELYPFATCELGGGLESTHHRRYIIRGMDVYAESLIKLGCGNNLIGYYMYQGGTNKIGKLSTLQESAATGYPNDYPILSYDFQAPLSEYGEVREQYRLLNMLHMFAASFGDVLAPMSAVDAEYEVENDDTVSLRYGMRTDGVSGFVFISHYQRLTELADLRDVVIDTGIVKFPAIDVTGDTAFFMPFNMDINGHNLKYATAQPLCKIGDRYFFAEIPGIKAEYGIEAEIRDKYIVTLTWDEARYARVLDGELFIGKDCDLYLTDDAAVVPAENKPYEYRHWDGNGFVTFNIMLPYTEPECVVTDTEAPDFEKPYAYELNIGGGRRITWKKIEVKGTQGFVEVDFDSDVLQLYVDGELKADMYYNGIPWRLPARMLSGRECYIAYSEPRGDHYTEKNLKNFQKKS